MQINQETVLNECRHLVDTLLSLPEIDHINISNISLQKGEPLDAKLRQAIQQSYHDYCSDVDLSIIVRFPAGESNWQDHYAKQIERFGFTEDKRLGALIAQKNVLRVVLKNGMRYDLVFTLIPDENAAFSPLIFPENAPSLWPVESTDRFWFIQIQALGKLYRKDYLISMHLANVNLNETLVQQMALRDEHYGTTHHRYGYQDEIAYLSHLNKCPIKTGNSRFDWIADRLWCAALTYDELMLKFDPAHFPRSSDFFAIWECYEAQRLAETKEERCPE